MRTDWIQKWSTCTIYNIYGLNITKNIPSDIYYLFINRIQLYYWYIFYLIVIMSVDKSKNLIAICRKITIVILVKILIFQITIDIFTKLIAWLWAKFVKFMNLYFSSIDKYLFIYIYLLMCVCARAYLLIDDFSVCIHDNEVAFTIRFLGNIIRAYYFFLSLVQTFTHYYRTLSLSLFFFLSHSMSSSFSFTQNL